MELKQAGAFVSRSTGMHYFFQVKTRKMDDSEERTQPIAVIALNTADAWGLIGDAVTLFMNGPDGRYVLSIEIVRP